MRRGEGFWGSNRHAFAALALWFACCELLIWPSADVPVIDDWTYAWSVQHLLESGRLAILPISAVYPVTQILWGALFCALQGFSFAALRSSTVVLAFIGACALYLILRELGSSRQRALIGTFCVACNPVSIVLAHSFMTDVPLVSLSTCAALAYVRGFNRRDRRLLWFAGVVCAAAVLVRQVAVVIPFAAAMVCFLTRDRALRRLAGPAALGGCGLALAVWFSAVWALGPSYVQTDRLERLRYVAEIGLVGYARLTVELIVMLSFMLWPLSLATAVRHRRARFATLAGAVSCVSVAWLLWLAPASFNPLDPERFTLSVYELGGARNLLAGIPEQPSVWPWVIRLAQLLMLLSLGAALRALVSALQRGRRGWFESPPFKFFVVLGMLQVGLVSALWLYCDRYYLALLPTVVVCVLGSLRDVRVSMPVAVAALAVQTLVGVVGTRDVLRYNQLCARVYAQLVASGVRPYDIDAGWSFNGWMLYAHAENLPAQLDRERDVPSVTSKHVRPYLFAKAPLEGYEPVQHLRWAGSSWPWPNELYVLRKLEAPVLPARATLR